MASLLEPWRIEQQKRADATLSRLLDANPGLSVDDGRPRWQMGTNLVAFGALDSRPVVLKYYDWRPRKDQEERALKLYAPTGLVPALYPLESDSILVMERLPGSTLTVVEQTAGQALRRRLYGQLGRALARIVDVAPGGPCGGRRDASARPGTDYEFYCQAEIGHLFDTVTGHAAAILAENDVPEEALLKRSLRALVDHRDAILAGPHFVQMDDLHTHNIMADGGELTGFIDLEMTRYGNEVLLLAAALDMAAPENPERWAWIRSGYEEAQGGLIPDTVLALASVAAPFSQWTRFMWYWTGKPGSFEEGARGWPIRDIKAITEGLLRMQL